MRAARNLKRAQTLAGFAVHAFTASGAAVAVLALNAAYQGEFPACFDLEPHGFSHLRQWQDSAC